MKCPACRHDNGTDAKFCEACGSGLARACSSCGATLSAVARFCSECGTAAAAAAPPIAASGRAAIDYTPGHLAERILAAQSALEARGSDDGERKTITALFADLKGSTALIETMDPEEARALIDPALALMMDAVHRYEGYVAQALGDGVLALFGAPIAHEDHAHRALYAALAMHQQMRRYGDELRGAGQVPLQMRVGVNTGEVVLRSVRKEDLQTDYVPVGHSTNIAARMEQLATPGATLVAEQTFKLTDGFFDFEALGETLIKGLERPLAIYELRGVGQMRTRLEVAARRGLTRFVGRHNEVDQLQRAREEVREGRGQIVGVVGEPGLGKSRLFYEFKRTVGRDCLLLEAFAIAHARSAPYVPVVELLRGYFDIEAKDDERRRREKVTGKVLALDRNLEDTLPYLFALLAVGAASAEIQQLDPQLRRARTIAAVKQLFLRESLDQPVIVIFEDLHWIDAETQAFLDALVEGLAAARFLLLVNYRPEYRHDWGGFTYYTQLRLAPLGKADAVALLDFLTGDSPGLAALKTLIVERTEGTPFFMEEVVQTLVEEGVLTGDRGDYRQAQATEALQIPDSVRGVLAARIDRLAANEKQVLQQLAVIGREFSAGLARAVVGGSGADFQTAMASLQAREFVYEQPAFPEVEYVFKHALTQEVAYGSVLQTRRRALHERTGAAIESLHADSLEDHWGELAHHYGHSDNVAKAVTYLHLAGRQAVRRTAYRQAENFLAQALEFTATLPASPARARRELALHTELGSVMLNTAGYAAATVERHYERAIALCEETGTSGELLPALAGLFLVYLLRGELERARTLAAKALLAAKRTEASSDLVTAYYMLGSCLMGLGEFVPAQAAQRKTGELYIPDEHHVLAARYGEDPGATILSFEAVTLFALGFPDQALGRAQQGIALAQVVNHDATLAQSLFWSAMVRLERREYADVRAEIERALEIATRLQLDFVAAFAMPMHGAALLTQGDVVAGTARTREGLDTYRAHNALFQIPFYLSLLARAEVAGGNVTCALSLIDEAMADAQRRHERQYEAELFRIKGELQLQSASDFDAGAALAEENFLSALDVARRQQAKSWELRAATSLARLWRQQGREEEARALLAGVYDWFTEGFDTPDLQDAKSLIDALSKLP